MWLFKRAHSFDVLSQHYGERYKWMILIIIGIGTIAGVLCTSSFNVAVPALTRTFQLGQDQVQWAMTAFLAAMTIAMLPAAWLLERFGLRRVFMAALWLLIAASIAGFYAQTFVHVVLTRTVQGVATGVLQPLGIMALMRLFPPHIQGRASGILIVGIAFTPAIAPSISGWLLDQFGWRAIFLLGVPFAMLALIGARIWLPAPRKHEIKPFDWPGLGWLSAATISLIEFVSSLHHSGLTTAWTWGYATLLVVSMICYVRHAHSLPHAIIQLHLFFKPTFSRGTFVAFAYGFGLFASTYLIPVFLQNAMAYSATDAGLLLLPSGIALVLTIPVAGRMADRFSPRRITLAGLAVLGASFLVFALAAGQMAYWEIVAATVIGRIGLGLILPALNLATLHEMEPHHLGQSSVVVSYARQLGGVVGVTMMAVFMEWREQVLGVIVPGIFKAYAQGFLLLSMVFVLAMIVAVGMKDARR
ncbi:drug resistance transporter, EmrB/QacA subfamily [Methylophilus rhizosphaerae]|uniref:Drug resistance transporter, EmrB/QacA subfamily n=1 Tax=Methylophilus rhizosphaerae TaxID=492660 RepID=A0A1G9A1D9_9PROT|nr:MFS transporter [Methylophilus rhizosphaerae]SDK21178.1 drug resistance transporter, EmrB/QacA subfamily [Methylophilus rhizosphaerae]